MNTDKKQTSLDLSYPCSSAFIRGQLWFGVFYEASIVSQRLHRVDPRGAASWKITGE
jgi:hypothetical protein